MRSIDVRRRSNPSSVMSFEKIKLKFPFMQRGDGQAPNAESQKRKTAIEAILLAEYETAQAAFDRARDNPECSPDINTSGKQYIEATVRLRKFLTDGEVPGDIEEKLKSGDSFSG
jgi:hypothetical protein